MRYKCTFCGKTFTIGKKKVRFTNKWMFKKFKEWVRYTLTLDYLSRRNNISKKTLVTRFDLFLNNPPPPQYHFLKLKSKLKARGISFGGYIPIDADWFGRKRCLILYKDALTGKIILWRLADGERKWLIYKDLMFLVNNGYPLKGVISDWKGTIVAAVNEVSAKLNREVPHQRCLVHTQLLAQGLITQRPRTEAGKSLQEIVWHLNDVKTEQLRRVWVAWFLRWEERYQDFVKQRTYSEDGSHWWYTHKNLRRAYRTIRLHLGSLFIFLQYKDIPKDTNGVEGIFSQLDTKLSRHRGMKQERKEALINWLLYLTEFVSTG